MMGKKYEKYEVIKKHPFDSHVPVDTRTLIVGTFPTREDNYKTTFPFFYAGEGNQFWPIVSKVFNHAFRCYQGNEAVEERKTFLTKRKIGLTDMLTMCYRKNESSLDKNIYPIKFIDLFAMLRNHDKIDTIILNGGRSVVGARGLFETYLHQNDISPPELTKINNIYEGWFKFENNRDIEILVPYSTSRTVIEKKRATFEQLVVMYRSCLT